MEKMSHNLDAFAATFCVHPPTSDEWTARRDVITGLSLKLYNLKELRDLPERFDVFERELERCYCSGAYFACIALAQSIVETLQHKKSGGDKLAMDSFLEYCQEDIDWLRGRRNDLLHAGRPSNEITLNDYAGNHETLEGDARSAVSIVYHVARAFVRCEPNNLLKR